MGLRKNRKILLLVLAVCIAVSVVFAETIIAGSLDHDCSRANCLICLKIEAAKYFIRTFKLAGILFSLAALLVYGAQIFLKYSEFIACPSSPIALKVRFNT